MGDQGSIYSLLQDVPVMVSPHYRLPKQIVVASELIPVADSAANLMAAYPFSVEREALADIEAARKLQRAEEERLEQWRKEYEEEKVKRQKLAARKIAPGFLDTDTRILQPEPLHATTRNNQQEEEEEEGSDKTTTTSAAAVDYHRFEPGLAPPDPWDPPENDLVALRSILGQQQQQPPPRPETSSPSYRHQYPPEGYWTLKGTTTNMPRPQKHTYPAASAATTPRHSSPPALPPKPFRETGSPTSTHTSPRVVAASLMAAPSSSQPSTPPHHSVSGSNSPVAAPPPPVPPHPPHSAPEDLIQELVNMGFSRPQAAEALEKNDNDLTRATNFLLDHGVG